MNALSSSGACSLAFLPAILLISNGVAWSGPNARDVRIITYNIHQGMGANVPSVRVNIPFTHVGVGFDLPVAPGRSVIDKIADQLWSYDPDIVLLQEVNGRSLASLGVDQASRIAKKLGMHVAYRDAHRIGSGLVKQQGNAILSRWNLHDLREVELNKAAGKDERRQALIARVEVPGKDKSLWIVVTHLASGNATLREAQVPILEEALRELDGPVVLAGDLNSIPDSNVIADILDGHGEGSGAFVDAFAQVGEGDGFTTPTDHRIDYILHRPGLRVLESSVLRDVDLSDHFPVLADFEFGEPEVRLLRFVSMGAGVTR